MRLSSLIGWATLTLVGVVFVLPMVAYCVFSVKATVWDNPRFARTYFAEILPFDEVVATRQWHNESWGCTYAIVTLPDDAPLLVPVAWTAREWLPTRASPLGRSTRDAIESCAKHWPEGIGARLQTILEMPDAFYYRDGVGEKVLIYAPDDQIAARIRFGG